MHRRQPIHLPVPLSARAEAPLAALLEAPLRVRRSEQSVAMPVVGQRSVQLWAALPAPPVGARSVPLAIATDCYSNIMKGALMKLIWTMGCIMALNISVCVAQTPSPAGGSSPTTASPAESSVSDAIAPTGRWNVAQAKCRAILSESDDDRAAIGMFYYGYLAARLNLSIIDTSRIENDLRHVFETCRERPDMTVVAAFRTLRQKSHS